jgi:hypothetical protein
MRGLKAGGYAKSIPDSGGKTEGKKDEACYVFYLQKDETDARLNIPYRDQVKSIWKMVTNMLPCLT